MAHVSVDVGARYVTRAGNIVLIEKETNFPRLKYRGDNRVRYSQYGKADKTRGKSFDLIMTKEEYDRFKMISPQQETIAQPIPVITKTVKIKADVEHLILNIDKRQAVLKIEVNQNGKLTHIQLASDYDTPVIQTS